MVVFPSAVAAVRCAVQMQQLLERRNRHAVDAILIRVGVSLGDAVRDNGDYSGEPVIQAARLCARAEAIEPLENEKLIIRDAAVLIDRSKGAKKLEARGYRLHSVFTLMETLKIYEQRGTLDDHTTKTVREFILQN